MESDLGKLFIGGISWNTDEDRLKEYFGSFGEVVEAVIMRDRNTGRARGFGFIVFADPAVAERVVAEKHVIDGRTVEAKKAVPRDDQQMINRNVVQGSSPVLGRTKKIFVGGLASTVSETDFKAYFDQFGTITDVVVMYDHNTQRPRGFGFITFDSEEAVERVLHKTFHELNGKMVEVKRAVPKELSPGPARSPITGYNYGFNRPTSFLSNYGQGYNLSSLGGYGVRMDGRFNPLGNRSALSPFNSLGYGMGMNLDPTLSLSIGGATNFNNNNLGYRRLSSPYRYSNPIGYGGATVGNDSPLGASTWNVWGNSGINGVANVSSPPPYMSNGGGRFGVFGNRGSNWGSSPISPQGDGNVSGYAGGATGFNGGENSYRLSGGGFGRNNGSAVSTASSFAAPAGGYAGSYGDLYQTGSVYGDTAWRSASPEIDGSSSFDNALGDVSEVAAKGSEDYIGGYSIGSRKTNRGIAA